MKVTFVNRHPAEGCFSFEELFENIKCSLPSDIEYRDFWEDPSRSRFRNMLAARGLDGDVLHITGGVSYFAIFLNGRKTVLTVHDIGHYTESLKGIRKALYGLFWFRLPLRRAAFVTAVSNHTKDMLLKHFRLPPDKVRVIPNCYPVDYRYDPKPFDESKPRILQVGTKPYKNVYRLVQALKGLPCKLVLVGALSEETKKRIAECGLDHENLVNLTHEEVLREYLRCDMVTFASVGEGFGLPIIEANAVGRPVVTSNVSVMPEVAGDAACFVDPFDVGSIRRGIERVIRDRDFRASLIRNGLENVKRFSPDRIAGLYAKLYEEVRG